MKKFKFLLLFLGVVFSAKSQINKGQFLLGGQLSFESSRNEGLSGASYKNNILRFSPDVGYFFIPKLAGGVRLNFSSYRYGIPGSFQIYKETVVSPFIRYYFLPQNKPVNVLVDLGYTHSKSKSKFTGSPDYFIQKAHGYSISAGPALFLSENIALEFLLGYNNRIKDSEQNTTTFYTGIGLQIHFGKTKSKK